MHLTKVALKSPSPRRRWSKDSSKTPSARVFETKRIAHFLLVKSTPRGTVWHEAPKKRRAARDQSPDGRNGTGWALVWSIP